MAFGNFSEVVPHFRGGRVVILGVSAGKRDKDLADTPVINETYPGFRIVAIRQTCEKSRIEFPH